MSNVTLAAAVLAGAAFLAPPAHAVTVNGADTITITNAVGSWLQVAEVIAIQASTGIDVALAANGANAFAPDQWDGNSGASNAIDGIYPASFPNIYHSANEGSGYLQVTLGTPANLASLTIYGRVDCCQERDVYNVTIADSLSNTLYSGTIDASINGFGTVTFEVAATPLPSTWLMLLGGFISLSFFAYSGTKKDSAALAT